MQLLPTEVVCAVQQGRQLHFCRSNQSIIILIRIKSRRIWLEGSLKGMLFLWDCLQKGRCQMESSFVKLSSHLSLSSLFEGQRSRGCLNSWYFFHVCVLGRDGRSQKSLCSCHLVSWNNKDSITGWLCMQIHPSEHKHTHVPQACRELQYQAEILFPSCFSVAKIRRKQSYRQLSANGAWFVLFCFCLFYCCIFRLCPKSVIFNWSCNPGWSYHGSLGKEMDGATPKKPVLFFTRPRVGRVHRI